MLHVVDTNWHTFSDIIFFSHPFKRISEPRKLQDKQHAQLLFNRTNWIFAQFCAPGNNFANIRWFLRNGSPPFIYVHYSQLTKAPSSADTFVFIVAKSLLGRMCFAGVKDKHKKIDGQYLNLPCCVLYRNSVYRTFSITLLLLPWCLSIYS